MSPTAAFIFNLVQDVNILRPLVVMAARDFGFKPLLLVSSKFSGRDPFGIWAGELAELEAASGASSLVFANDWEAAEALAGHGILFAASESHLPNHATTHDVFRLAPPGYLRVTLQHGFECIGFQHSADHSTAHGETASFGADLVCAWGDRSLSAISPSQRAKMIVTGPTSRLQVHEQPAASAGQAGIVCENLHSVRFRGPGARKVEFVDAFARFCGLMQRGGRTVALRPHPGGQYVLKNKVALPANATIENSPMYRLDLRQFAYGISAPSSVLIDMLLADIPTAVWSDAEGGIDGGHYAALHSVSTPEQWAEFAAAAIADPAQFLERQRQFLAASGMVLDPAEIYARFAALFDAAGRRDIRPLGASAQRHRIQFVANAHIPTLQLSFERPLAGPVARGEVGSDLITEQELRAEAGLLADEARVADWVGERLERSQPTAMIFCRYSGPAWRPIVDWARSRGVPVVYHIDDDLLAIPSDIGERKHALHNAPERLEAVRSLLQTADLVYASTDRLRAQLLSYFPEITVVAGKIYCPGTVIRRPEIKDVATVGYMASADHAHNLTMVLPAIEKLLDSHQNVRFELFGSIPVPDQLKRFGPRVSSAPPIADYTRFLPAFAEREWDIGICPLVPIDFNLMKANTKWVEYSAAGVAVVASRGTVYDSCCEDGCGRLADGVEEWFEELDKLVRDPAERLSQVTRAQARLKSEFGLKQLREQVFDVISLAKRCATGEPGRIPSKV